MEYIFLDRNNFVDWIEQFCTLYRKCFTAKINEKIVKWRYLENPHNDLLVCVAIDNGRLIANCAASPCEIYYKGKLEKSAISLNLMTDPEYRGRGIFVDLAKRLYSHMEQLGYKSVLEFPNYISNPTLIKHLGRHTIYEIPTLKLILSDFIKEIESDQLILVDDEFELNYYPFKHRTKTIYLNKNREYLKWRYFQNPQNEYKNFVILDDNRVVRSFLICKEYEEQLNIVDYCFYEECDIEPLIFKGIEYAKKLNKESVTIWSQIGTDEHLFLQKLGFRNNYPITYFSGRLFSSSDALHDFYDYRNWFVTMGDNNVY